MQPPDHLVLDSRLFAADVVDLSRIKLTFETRLRVALLMLSGSASLRMIGAAPATRDLLCAQEMVLVALTVRYGCMPRSAWREYGITVKKLETDARALHQEVAYFR